MISRGVQDRSDRGKAMGWRAQEKGSGLWKAIAMKGGWIDFIESDRWRQKSIFTRWNSRNGVRMGSRIDWILGKNDWVHGGRLQKGGTEFLGWSDHEAVLIEIKMGDSIEWGRGHWKGHGGLFMCDDGVERFRVDLELWRKRSTGSEWREMKEWCMSWWEQEDRMRRRDISKEKKKAVAELEEARGQIVEYGERGPPEELVERTSWIMGWIKDIDSRRQSVDRWRSRLWWDL